MSNQRITGVVDRTWDKDKQTRFGTKKIHYCEVDGVSFETGFKKEFSEDEMVDIAVKHQYGALQYQKGAPVEGLPMATGAASVSKGNFQPRGGSNKGRGNFPIDPADGQMSIIRQSSMDRAVTIVRDMIKVGTITTPTTKEDYLKLCIEIALNITDYASGNDIMKMAEMKATMKEIV